MLFAACSSVTLDYKWGFPKIRGTFLGVPIIRIIVFVGLCWDPLFLGEYKVYPGRASGNGTSDPSLLAQ